MPVSPYLRPPCKPVEEHLQALVDAQSPTRLIEPADIANTVAFFVSADASMITGKTVTVDGRRTH